MLLGALVAVGPAAASTPPYTVQLLHWDVTVGPPPQETCSIVGELYKPAGASPTHRVPAILTTNGFGGSYKDQEGLAATFASRGYAVLTYSGLGFGGSGCKIELDSPLWDGEAASQLITFLGGGSAATNGTTVNYVIHDAVAHNGRHYRYDPRVGMIGGSYGGEVQFAAADIDPRLDAIIPFITWNNLAYSLVPNNALTGADISESSGVAKFEWIDLFSADGIADGVTGASTDPSRLTPCPNFDPRACSAMVQLNASGNGNPSTFGFAEQASVESYIHAIKIPVMLMQGEDDTLFNLHESVATYEELRAQHTPVKLVWQSWGHSNGTPAPGEWSNNALNPNGTLTVEGRLVAQWFAHYLKGAPAAPALNFSYYQPWVNAPAATAARDYASAPAYPVPAAETLKLSGTNALVGTGSPISPGTASFLVPPPGAPMSVTEVSGVSQTVPLFDAPGTFAEYETPPLAHTEDVVGIPTLRVQLHDSLENDLGSLDPSGGLALFFKLEDIAPNGTVTLPDRLISPARFDDLESPVTVTLPGIVHRFPAGDRIALVIASSDAAYRGNALTSAVSVSTDPANPGTLTLPLASPASAGPLVFAQPPAARKPPRPRPRPARSRRGRRSGRRRTGRH
ncbi:CocE/NonD family hydrolase [Conexibacter sp. DBS9H8]|uniref:CocE/NonD family hydrolase n=1 Tax=Conexibacter sp. DBS9H8 TaxID=2937801 RepID=UPI00200FF11C|nr:CocE/NonD family hydrolase [Conexibacter sp. DBS9H8]